jgi:hypothetical protein
MKRVVLLCFVAAACSHPQSTSQRAPHIAMSLDTEGSLPPSPDVSREIMGYAVLGDGERVLRQLATDGEHADLKALQIQTAMSMGIDPVVGEVLDLKRPAAVAALNPMLLARNGVRPFVAMLPVVPRAQLEAALARRGAKLEKQPWGFAVDSAQGKLYFGYAAHDYVVIAWRPDLLAATEKLLGPRLTGKRDAPVVLHASVDNLYAAFGPQLEALLGHFSQVASAGGPSGDPSVAFALRGLRQVSRFADSVTSLELLLDLDPGGLTVTARLDGKPDGAWAGYVKQQESGPAWGVQFLPRDAVMVYTTHANAQGRAAEIDDQVAYLAHASSRKLRAGDEDRWRKAMQKAVSSTGGELAYAVWPAREGGMGVGGAYRLTDPALARESVMAVYSEISEQLGGMLARALSIDAERLADKFVVKRKQARIADTDVDLVELTPKFPASAMGEKRLFETMFGPKLVLATAFVGDTALFALGRDWAARLETMLKTSQGERAASLGDEPDFAEALQFHAGARVSMSYLETGRMARFAAGLLVQATDLDPPQRQAISRILSQVGRGAIVTTTNAKGARYELTTHVPRAAILGAARLNGALWRVALSPLVNPPMMPPMPVPPPHVAPSLSPAPDARSM